MGHAIASTFKAVVGSSVTTVAGFAALCFMTFALGRDLGIVMAKGVIIGVICCVTILPSLILAFDKQIEKTKHRPLIKSVDGATSLISLTTPDIPLIKHCLFASFLISAIAFIDSSDDVVLSKSTIIIVALPLKKPSLNFFGIIFQFHILDGCCREYGTERCAEA